MTNNSWSSARPTIKDIAKAAEVDPSTVTRALQGSPRVKQATRDKIQALAAELGYVPNMAARTLVTQRSHLIGLVIPDMTNPFFAALARGIEDEAGKHGLQVITRNTEGREASERDAIQFFGELKVDGLLVPMARCPKTYYNTLKLSAPVVHINRSDTRHFVTCDARAGSDAIMEHLLQLGHRRIAFVAGPGGPALEPKMEAYRDALVGAGLQYEPELVVNFTGALDDCDNVAEQLYAASPRPTAVFAWNDLCAMGVIHALKLRGVDVPGTISVAGHDDIALSACYDPPLTTVHWPMYELGVQSVRYMIRLREGQRVRRPKIPNPELVVRGSTAKPSTRAVS